MQRSDKSCQSAPSRDGDLMLLAQVPRYRFARGLKRVATSTTDEGQLGSIEHQIQRFLSPLSVFHLVYGVAAAIALPRGFDFCSLGEARVHEERLEKRERWVQLVKEERGRNAFRLEEEPRRVPPDRKRPTSGKARRSLCCRR